MLFSYLSLTTFLLLTTYRQTEAADDRKFSSNFKFGVATASYQVEGAWDIDGKGENIWDNLTHSRPELIDDGSNGDLTCNAYHKTHTDVSLLEDLNVDFFRFSISWSRILPTGYLDGGINEAGVLYYENLLELLNQSGIEPMVTLFHWDLPQPLQEEFGGWVDERIVDIFANYAKLMFDLFGDKVKYWITFNEPHTFCSQGYETGRKAPAVTDNPGVDLYKCGHNVLKSHARAYRIYEAEYKDKYNGKISMSLNTDWSEPDSEDQNDLEASERKLQFSFGWFAHPIVHGNYPQIMIDRIKIRSEQEGFNISRLPEMTPEEVKNLEGTYDFLGVNHYSTMMTSWIEDAEISTPSSSNDVSVRSYHNESWEGSASSWLKVVPWGFRKLVKWVKDRYNNPEIIITENGFSDPGGVLDDDRRINYIREYLSSLLEAIYDDDVNVTGYTSWSFMDNFEWMRGYTEKFGLYSVDFDDWERPRTPKASAGYYKSVIATKCLVDNCPEV